MTTVQPDVWLCAAVRALLLGPGLLRDLGPGPGQRGQQVAAGGVQQDRPGQGQTGQAAQQRHPPARREGHPHHWIGHKVSQSEQILFYYSIFFIVSLNIYRVPNLKTK